MILRLQIAQLLFLVLLSILLPSTLGAKAASAQQEQIGRTYVVQANDSLSRIASQFLGAQRRWPEILQATNERAATDSQVDEITNANRLLPGQTIWIPAAEVVQDATPSTVPTTDLTQAITETPTATATPTAMATPTDEPTDSSGGPTLPEPSTTPTITPTVTPTEVEQPTPASYSCATEQNGTGAERLYPSRHPNGLLGYVNEQGDFRISGQFQFAGEFSEGFAVVSKDGELYDYIDSNGDFPFELDYADAGRFLEGLAPVRSSSSFNSWPKGKTNSIQLSGYINCEGRYEISPRYLLAMPFTDGRARVIDKESQVHYIDRAGVSQLEVEEPETRIATTSRISVTVPSAQKSGQCSPDSAYGNHSTLFSCMVNEGATEPTTYDPCILANNNSSIVCGYPNAPFEAASLLVPINFLGESTIEDLWLTVAGDDDVSCQRLAVPIEIYDAVQADGMPSNDKVQLTYACSDETYIVGTPADSAPYGNLVAQTALVTGIGEDDEIDEYVGTVPITELLNFSTKLTDSGGGPSDVFPPTRGYYYWSYSYAY